MKDAIKTLYEHWINVHTTTPAEFKGGSVKWFDDSKLIKPEYRK